jgi:4-carboxymuconolactone decarboxylase
MSALRRMPVSRLRVLKRTFNHRDFLKGGNGIMGDLPRWYSKVRQQYRESFEALENLGETIRKQGPLDEKTSHLIQLAAAAAIRSEGSVHSHARRAIKAGATPEEIYHTIMLLTSTIGFPTTSAALSWVYDIVGDKK